MIAAAVAVSWPALAATWIVHPDGTGDFPTIRAAVEGASSGDVIELADGIFAGEGNRDVDLLGKTLVIRSASGNPSSCILDCEGQSGWPRRAFLLQSGEVPGTAVEGLTIRNGRAWHTGFAIQGGAILAMSGAHLRIERCVFENNEALDFDWGAYGGAVHAALSDVEVIDCVFSGNRADTGGALSGWFSIIRGCTFVDNAAIESDGAVRVLSSALIENCTFVRNTAPWGGVVHMMAGAELTLRHTILAFNQCEGAISGTDRGTAQLSCCDLYGNEGGDWIGAIADQLGVSGNLNADPRFCAPAADDFGLADDSPCSPGQNPECGLIGAWPVACAGVPARAVRWGFLKSLYRERAESEAR